MRYLGGRRRRWEDNIRMDNKERVVNSWNLIKLAQDGITEGPLLNLRVPKAIELVFRTRGKNF